MSDSVERFAHHIESLTVSWLPVEIIARFNGVDYALGRAVPANPLAVEVVELLRHLADEIEAVGLMREVERGDGK
jgi:hypothetical protein